jgi:hypothetical protein
MKLELSRQVRIYLALYVILQRFIADSCVTVGRILSVKWVLFMELCCVRVATYFTCLNMSSAAVVIWFLFPFQVSEVVPLSERFP